MPSAALIKAKLVPALVRVPAERFVADAARFTANEARHGIQDGAIARTIIADVRGFEAIVRGSGEALAVEFGRKPGTPPPPVGALRAWAASHGMADLVYPLARAISQRGIKGRFFVRKAVQKLRSSELPRLLAKAVSEIQSAWTR